MGRSVSLHKGFEWFNDAWLKQQLMIGLEEQSNTGRLSVPLLTIVSMMAACVPR